MKQLLGLPNIPKNKQSIFQFSTCLKKTITFTPIIQLITIISLLFVTFSCIKVGEDMDELNSATSNIYTGLPGEKIAIKGNTSEISTDPSTKLFFGNKMAKISNMNDQYIYGIVPEGFDDDEVVISVQTSKKTIVIESKFRYKPLPKILNNAPQIIPYDALIKIVSKNLPKERWENLELIWVHDSSTKLGTKFISENNDTLYYQLASWGVPAKNYFIRYTINENYTITGKHLIGFRPYYTFKFLTYEGTNYITINTFGYRSTDPPKIMLNGEIELVWVSRWPENNYIENTYKLPPQAMSGTYKISAKLPDGTDLIAKLSDTFTK